LNSSNEAIFRSLQRSKDAVQIVSRVGTTGITVSP
jgi:hypothetical protein